MTATPNVVQRDKIGEWLKANDRSVSWLAKKLAERIGRPISFWTVRRIVSGERQPQTDEGQAIMSLTNGAVTANDFYGLAPSEPERAAEAA